MTPFYQGQLDALCGVYAVINASRLAAEPYQFLRRRECRELFCHLVDTLWTKRLLAKVAAEGMAQAVVSAMLKAANEWLGENRQLHLTYAKPFHNNPNIELQKLKRELENHFRDLSSSAIICLSGALHHWTVIRSVRSNRIELCDSLGYQFIYFKSCSIQNTKTQPKRYQLISTALFLVQCNSHQ